MTTIEIFITCIILLGFIEAQIALVLATVAFIRTTPHTPQTISLSEDDVEALETEKTLAKIRAERLAEEEHLSFADLKERFRELIR